MRVPAGLALMLLAFPAAAERLPLIDAHIHYSHDAWDMLPPKQAPSMHDGWLATLDAVVDHYSDLVAFLRTLSVGGGSRQAGSPGR